MAVSIRRISAGDGYRYLLRSVAVGDGQRASNSPLTRYYTEAGTPPGRWMGAGLAGVDRGRSMAVGAVVSEEQLFRLLGMGCDPVSGQPLGRAPIGAASALGTVAGFDLTFSVPKSVSALWAVADAGTQALIAQAHYAAIDDTLAYAEREIFHTRVGVNGVAQVNVRGVVAAAFDHWDSRANDPHLHTHVVVANRVQTSDAAAHGDAWRTLDSRSLFRAVVTLSELHQALVMDRVSQVLGVDWDARARRHSAAPQYEITGVPDALREEFSQRSAEIEDEKNDLVENYRRAHGREPTTRTMLRLRQWATLKTRDPKQLHSLAELTTQWRQRAARHVGVDPAAWVSGLTSSGPARALRAADVDADTIQRVAERALAAVAARRATFSRWNVAAEVHRQLQPIRLVSPDDRHAVADRVTDSALGLAVLLSAPELAHTPAQFTRADGTSQFRHRGAERYTTAAILAAEDRLLAAGRDTGGPVAAVALPGTPDGLSDEQAGAVTQVAVSGRVLDVLVGAAGTGKTTALAGLLAAWRDVFGSGSVVGLAPSATAADVLGAELGIATENTAKWLTELARQRERSAEIARLRFVLHQHRDPVGRGGRRLAATITSLENEADRWRVRPGQLVIVDEASMASTLALDAIVGHVHAAGGKVVLVGDPAQLSAVEAGGAFDLLVRDRATTDAVPQLVDIHRFIHTWEKRASTRLRSGDPGVIDVYGQQDRIHDGDAAVTLDRAYAAWAADRQHGLRTLLIASDAETVTALNRRAHNDLVTAGAVAGRTITLPDGTFVASGDTITTRRNERTLSTGQGWVKNGDQWRVVRTHGDGSLTVHRLTGSRTIRLPAAYVAEHVELGYATTAHRAQGQSVDTAHAIVTGPSMTREALYVAMTRGRQANHAYVATDHDPDPDTAHLPTPSQTAHSVLTAVLANSGIDLSAHETIRAEQDATGSWAQLVAEYDTLAASAQHDQWWTLIQAAVPDAKDRVAGSPALPALMTALRRADAHGVDVETVFPMLVAARELDSAADVAAVLHDRVERFTARATATTTARSVSLIAGLHPEARRIADPDARRALADRAHLLAERARTLAELSLTEQHPWTRWLGPVPTDPTRREQFMRAVTTVAAYRDRWAVTTDDPLGPDRPGDLAYGADRHTAAHQLAAARSCSRDTASTPPWTNAPAPEAGFERQGPTL